MPYKETGQTIVSYEYPGNSGIKAYPINNEDTMELYNKYASIPNHKMIPAGRLAEYRYYDMNDIIEKYAL
jgi:UDP-galactopyranose mutase